MKKFSADDAQQIASAVRIGANLCLIPRDAFHFHGPTVNMAGAVLSIAAYIGILCR